MFLKKILILSFFGMLLSCGEHSVQTPKQATSIHAQAQKKTNPNSFGTQTRAQTTEIIEKSFKKISATHQEIAHSIAQQLGPEMAASFASLGSDFTNIQFSDQDSSTYAPDHSVLSFEPFQSSNGSGYEIYKVTHLGNTELKQKIARSIIGAQSYEIQVLLSPSTQAFDENLSLSYAMAAQNPWNGNHLGTQPKTEDQGFSKNECILRASPQKIQWSCPKIFIPNPMGVLVLEKYQVEWDASGKTSGTVGLIQMSHEGILMNSAWLEKNPEQYWIVIPASPF